MPKIKDGSPWASASSRNKYFAYLQLGFLSVETPMIKTLEIGKLQTGIIQKT